MREFDEEEIWEFLEDNQCEECRKILDGIHCTTIRAVKVCPDCCTCDDKDNGDYTVQTIIYDKSGEVVCISMSANHTWADGD